MLGKSRTAAFFETFCAQASHISATLEIFLDLAQFLLAASQLRAIVKLASMALEQAQHLSLQQTLSPQMRQSLQVLQAPLAELEAMANAELARNPALEEAPRDEGEEEPGEEGVEVADWRDPPPVYGGREQWTEEALERRSRLLESRARPPTLAEHLRAQVGDWEGPEREAFEMIAGSLDSSGYYRGRIEEVAWPLGLTVAQAEEVLRKVQALDPPGVAARDPRECLLLQLEREGRGQSLEARIVAKHLEALAKNRFSEIAHALRATPAAVRAAAEEIRKLDPRPGSAFEAEESPEVAPEVIVERGEDGDFDVRLNEERFPNLRLAGGFKDLLGTVGDMREAREFVRERLREGRFFLDCIEQRKATVLAIARSIAARQRDFLESGPLHLRPMTMQQVAEEVGVHETTVSRAVSGKYMLTPHGLFEMKYFFRGGF
ncbi:MAG: RNA polymerase factor sigma-54, partial [Terrimicrobiaceae bacterium]|nr:RNA polymerase factor sigma-54 [Terrimicrobiaceae bacterium]